MEVTESGKVIDVRLVHEKKAALPMAVIESEKVTDARFMQL
jgi:hypothetical protein